MWVTFFMMIALVLVISLVIGGVIHVNDTNSKTSNITTVRVIDYPAGFIQHVADATIPDGWLPCDGSEVDRNLYKELFGSIGYTYGGSGNTFNVPDIRGRTIIGSGTGIDMTLRSLADTGGSETHQLTIEELPSHNHPIEVNVESATSSEAANSTLGEGPNMYNAEDPDPTKLLNGSSFTGSDVPFSIMSPFITLTCMIKY